MACTGYGDCKQGRRPCRTPLTCSGAPVDQAIESFRLHRVPAPAPVTPTSDTGWTAAQFLTALFAGVCAVLAIVAALDN